LTVLARRARIVSAVFLICVAGSGLASFLATPSYTASAELFFSVSTADSVDDLQQGANFTRDQMASFASLVTTPTVLQPVVNRLDLSRTATQLARQVEVTSPNGTVLLDIEVSDTEARRAATVANAIAAQVIDVVGDLAPTGTVVDRPAVEVTVVTPAATPRTASSPDVLLNLAAGVVLGLGLGVLVALAREALDTRVRTAAEIAALTSRPVIGELGVDGAGKRRVVLEADPHSPHAEAYRKLRTNLQFLDVARREDGARRRRPVLAVTSSLAGEGKSTVAMNLAVALAETSARVLLVDADLRRPSIATRLGLEGAAGLTTVLLDQAALSDVVQPWGRTDLEVLTSGPLPPNPTELLSSAAMHRLLGELREHYDFVVVDCPPVLPVADGAIVSQLVDGTILLANVTKVRRHQLGETLRNLAQVDAPVLGVVLNQTQRDQRTYGYAAPTDAGGQPGTRPPAPRTGSPVVAGRGTDGRATGLVPGPAPARLPVR
jgi:capsular exopolysaccharide synthesis family protein